MMDEAPIESIATDSILIKPVISYLEAVTFFLSLIIIISLKNTNITDKIS